MEIRALDFLPLPNSQILRLTLWVELGHGLCCSGRFCVESSFNLWELEMGSGGVCVCVSKPGGDGGVILPDQTFQRQGHPVFAHRASALWWTGSGILGAGSVRL